ncbi:MAG: ogt, partial [Verrucomicrobiales bacterium]|nr:ogt [Verrucomicrobiales bacterium]
MVAILISVVVAFWPAFSAGFVWDDDSVLTGNPLMRGPLHLLWFSTQPVDYFPVTYSSLWLEWRLWGMNPLGYHVTNILLHAASAVLLWRLFLRLRFPAAWLPALLFAVHPVNVESVAWIAERKNVLAMFFYVLTAWAFVIFAQTRNKRFYLLSIATFALSLLAKPAAVAWPIIAFALLWFVKRNETGKASETNSQKLSFADALKTTAPFFATAAVLSVVAVWFQTYRAIGPDLIHHNTVAHRIAMAGGAVWFYLWKALVPFPVMFVYPQWKIDTHSLVAFVPVLALVAIAAVLWTFRKSWGKPLLFALGYFVLLLLPVLGLVDIYFQRFSYVADHWQYFALPAVLVVVAFALVKLKVEKIIGPVLVIALAAVSYGHTRTFHDSEILWTRTLEKNPDCWLALNNLAVLRYQAGKVQDAVNLNNKSLAVHPDQPEAHTALGIICLDAGKLDDAESQLRAALQINPSYETAHFNLAGVYRARGLLAEAIAEYREAIRLTPGYAAAHNNLGCLLAVAGKPDEAIRELRLCLTLDPNYADALSNLGSMLNDQHHPDEALPLLRKATALNSRGADGHLNLGNSLLALNKVADAQSEYMAALQLNSSLTLARFGVANCLLRSGQLDDAAKLYKQVIDAEPRNAESHFQLATILL